MRTESEFSLEQNAEWIRLRMERRQAREAALLAKLTSHDLSPEDHNLPLNDEIAHNIIAWAGLLLRKDEQYETAEKQISSQSMKDKKDQQSLVVDVQNKDEECYGAHSFITFNDNGEFIRSSQVINQELHKPGSEDTLIMMPQPSLFQPPGMDKTDTKLLDEFSLEQNAEWIKLRVERRQAREAALLAKLTSHDLSPEDHNLPLNDEIAHNIIAWAGLLLRKDEQYETAEKQISSQSMKDKKDQQSLVVDVQNKDEECYGAHSFITFNDNGEFIRSSQVINQELHKPGSEDTLIMMPQPSLFQPPGMDKTDTKLLDFFYNILAKKGQMDLADSELEEYIELLSEKSQIRIFSFGGLGSYLCTDPRFSVSQNIASIVSPGDYPWQEEKYSYGNGNQFNLNPGAKEFIPQRASHASVLSEKHDMIQNMSSFTNVALNSGMDEQLSLFGNDKNDGIPATTIERNAHVPDLCSHTQQVTNKSDLWSSYSAMGETTLMSSVWGTSPYTTILKAVHGVDEEQDDESDFFFTSQKITSHGTLLNDHTRMQPASDKSAALCKAVSATMNQDADQSLFIQPLNAPLTVMQSQDKRVETLSHVPSKEFIRSSLVINQELPKPGSEDSLNMMPYPSPFQPPGMDKTDTQLLDFFYNILAKKGQMDLTDSELEEYIELLSEKSQTRIFFFGGLGSYLCTDPRFSISQNIASIVSPGDYPWQEEKYSYGNGNQFNLNPGAKEFIPQRASHASVLPEKHDRNQNISPFTDVALNTGMVEQLSLFGNDKNDGIPVATIERNAHVPGLCSHTQPVTNKSDLWSSYSAMGETTLMSSVWGTSPYTPILKAVHGVDEEKDDESDFFFTSQKITSPGTLLDDHTRMQPASDKSAAICKTVSATMNQDADQSLFIQPLNAPSTFMQSLDRRVETLSHVSSNYGVLQGHHLPALGNDSNRLTSDQDSTPLTSDQDSTTLTSDQDSAPLTGHEQPDVSEPLSSKGCFCVQEDSWMNFSLPSSSGSNYCKTPGHKRHHFSQPLETASILAEHKIAETQTDIIGIDLEELFVELITIKKTQTLTEDILKQQAATKEALNSCQEQFSLGRSVIDELKHDVTFIKNRIQMAESSEERWKENFATLVMDHEILKFQNQAQMVELKKQLEAEQITASNFQEALTSCLEQLSHGRSMTDELKRDVTIVNTRIQMTETLVDRLKEVMGMLTMDHEILKEQSFAEVAELKKQLEKEQTTVFNVQKQLLYLVKIVAMCKTDIKILEADNYVKQLSDTISQLRTMTENLPRSVCEKYEEFCSYINLCIGFKNYVEVNFHRLQETLKYGSTVDISEIEINLPALPLPFQLSDGSGEPPSSWSQAFFNIDSQALSKLWPQASSYSEPQSYSNSGYQNHSNHLPQVLSNGGSVYTSFTGPQAPFNGGSAQTSLTRPQTPFNSGSTHSFCTGPQVPSNNNEPQQLPIPSSKSLHRDTSSLKAITTVVKSDSQAQFAVPSVGTQFAVPSAGTQFAVPPAGVMWGFSGTHGFPVFENLPRNDAVTAATM